MKIHRALISVLIVMGCSDIESPAPTDLTSADVHNVGAAFSNASFFAYNALVGAVLAGQIEPVEGNGEVVILDTVYECPYGFIGATGTIAYTALADGGTLAGQITMTLGDAADNSHDCGVTDGLYLNGTSVADIEATVSPTKNRGTLTIDTTIGLNRLASDGSYIFITDDCPVHLIVEVTTDGAYTSGTICGNAWNNSI